MKKPSPFDEIYNRLYDAVGLLANPTVDNRIRRKQLKCPICPPNKAENAKRKARHGPKKKRRPR